MHDLALWVEQVLVPTLGAPGLFVAAVLDSFLFLPELNDILVVSWSASRPATAWIPVTMVTLGSVAGCSLIWWIGDRGGEPLLERRIGKQRVERTRDTFVRWRLLALAVPAILPPPVPFKVFVLSAGVFGISFRRFVITVALARAVRYGFWSVMGILYGAQAVELLRGVDGWVKANLPMILAAAAALLLIGLAGYLVRRRSPRDAG